MHARVTTISGSPADADAGIDFRANVVPFAREQGKGAILLVGPPKRRSYRNHAVGDEQALRATEESANALEAHAAGQMGAAQAPTVGRYEVAAWL
jgi:hypothetical protein